jgi:hypothetical protein
VTEAQYQKSVLEKLVVLFPDCVLMKNDASYLQGIPDWTLLWKKYWAMLEIKKSSSSRRQPNQEYYVERLNSMSFAAFICPENEEAVLNELQAAFASRGRTRVS